MNKILVIGASGQLGSVIIDRLLENEQDCAAFIRPGSSFKPRVCDNLSVVYGDLADASSIDRACVGINQVIATASAIIPRRGDKFGVNEIDNYRNLIAACQHHSVEQLVYVSAFTSPHDEQIPEFRVKRQIEQLIVNSGIPFTIFRCAAFMDIYYAVMGSRLVMEGVARPTLLRGFWLTKLFHHLTHGLLEDRRVALIPGNGKARHAFVCIDDVAAFMVRSLALPAAKNRTIELGGPEVLSWQEVIDIYEQLLARKINRLSIPNWFLCLAKWSLKPFSGAGENVMSLLQLLSRDDCLIDMTEIKAEFGLPMTDTRQFLTKKMSKHT